MLRRDPYWSIYALGDLDPRRAHHCQWLRDDAGSVLLLYREFSMPIVVGMGDPSILERVRDVPPPCFFQIPEHFLDSLEAQRTLDWKRAMVRFRLEAVDFRASTSGIPVSHLGPADHDALVRLYADGDATGEAPDFYIRNQVDDGAFFGVRDAATGDLVAAGGTHLLSETQSVAAIGNVYTARSHRGRGLARAVTSAIADHLLRSGFRTIALNVKRQNASAIRIYEQLGFVRHCDYWEAFAGR